MKWTLIILLSCIGSFQAAANCARAGMELRKVNLDEKREAFQFELTLEGVKMDDEISIDSLRLKKQLKTVGTGSFGTIVETKIVSGKVLVTGIPRSGGIKVGGELTDVSLSLLRQSKNRRVTIFARHIFKEDTISSGMSFSVLP